MFYFEFWIYFQCSCLSEHMRRVASAFHCASCCSYKIQFCSISAWFRSKFLCSTCVCLCLIVTYSFSLVFFTCSLVLQAFSLVFYLHSLMFTCIHSCSLLFSSVCLCSDSCVILVQISGSWNSLFARWHFAESK